MIGLMLLDELSTMFFCFAAAVCFLAYMKTHERLYLLLAALPVCYTAEIALLNHTTQVIYLVNLADNIPITNHISAAPLRIPLYAVILLLDLLVLLELIQKPWKPVYALYLLPGLAASVFLTFRPQTNLVVWLFYSIRQFYRFAFMAVLGTVYLKNRESGLGKRISSIKTPIAVTLVFNCSILIEDALMISNLEQVVANIPFMSERNISENLLWIFLCAYSAYTGYRALFPRQPEEVTSAPSLPIPELLPSDSLSEFSAFYKLTPREEEILKCLIDCKSTAEICDELHVALGTVKTHTHNIYSKINISGKSELLKAIKDFQRQEDK